MAPDKLVLNSKYRLRDQNTNMTHEVEYMGIAPFAISGFRTHVFNDIHAGTVYLYGDIDVANDVQEVPEFPDLTGFMGFQYHNSRRGANSSPAPSDSEPPVSTAVSCTNHEYVNVGFMHTRMACRHCGKDQ